MLVQNKTQPTEVSLYLKPEHVNVKWNPTAHITTVQKYITCEGRFSSIHHYQLRFLAHILGDRPMDLPYFLYKSLLKMYLKLQKILNYSLHNLYHRGLIKILIVYHLRKKKTTWDKILREEGFGSINSKRKVGRPKKRDTHEQTSVAHVSDSS